MSKPRSRSSTPAPSATRSSGRQIGIGLALALALVAGLVGWSLLRPPRSDVDSSEGEPGERTRQATNLAPAAKPVERGPAMERALGRWQRTDGDYVIEIVSADAASGRLEAKYFNPQPIHVGRAEARHEGGKLTVLVELQDVNYPGSTYRLTYFPTTDQWFGTYYQATLGQSFEVEFGRLR